VSSASLREELSGIRHNKNTPSDAASARRNCGEDKNMRVIQEEPSGKVRSNKIDLRGSLHRTSIG